MHSCSLRMQTLSRTPCIVTLLSVSVSWNLCVCWISLCTDDTTSSQNGTSVPAKLGAPVSVYFCVHSDYAIYSFINIKHHNHRSRWYGKTPQAYDKMYVNFEPLDPDQLKTIINITILQAENQDFEDVFHVTVCALKQSPLFEKVEFWFGLKQEDDVTKSAHDETVRSPITVSSTLPDVSMTNPESASMPVTNNTTTVASAATPSTTTVASTTTQSTTTVASTTTQSTTTVASTTTQSTTTVASTTTQSTTTVASTTTQSTTTVASTTTKSTTTVASAATPSKRIITRATTTTSKPECPPQDNSGCPKMWYPVGDKMCLTVLADPLRDVSKDYCTDYGAHMPNETDINGFKPCLTYLLQDSPSKVIPLQEGKSLNLWTGNRETTKSFHRVACLVEKEKLVPAVVTSFYLEQREYPPYDKYSWRQDLLRNTPVVVDINATRGRFYFTCKATGYPVPQVEITRDNTQLELTSGAAVIARADCSHSGIYTCHARNFHSSELVHKQIQFSHSFEKVLFTITNRVKRYTNIRTGDDVEMRCSVDGCPAPILLTITDDINQTVAHVPSNSSLVTEIRRVQCSDMGSYYCRAEAEDGGIIDSKVDLAVTRCPVQLCRGEGHSKIISAAVKETVNFSLCLISADSWLDWSTQNDPNKISVIFTRRDPAGVYWTADITINNIQESDYGKKTINIRDRDGSFEYHLQLKDTQNNRTTVIHGNISQPPSSTQDEKQKWKQGNTWIEEGNAGTFVAVFACGIIVSLLATLILILIRRRGHQTRIIKAEDADKNIQSQELDKQQCSLYENTTRDFSKEDAPPCSQYEEIRDTARSIYEEIGNVKVDMSGKDVELELSDIQDVVVEYQNTVPSL